MRSNPVNRLILMIAILVLAGAAVWKVTHRERAAEQSEHATAEPQR